MTNTTDASKLESALADIRVLLATAEAASSPQTVKDLATRLTDVAKPQETMKLLATYLFRNPSSYPDDKISSSDALQILGYLVTLDSSLYLKAASRGVRDEAVRLTKTASPSSRSDSVAVSLELTNVLIQQLSSGLDVEVAQNSMEALTSCCKMLGATYGATVVNGIVQVWKEATERLVSQRAEASTICVRCAATIVDISILDDSFMVVAMDGSAYDLFVRFLLDDTDPLVQMTMLDFLDKLASSRPMHSSRARWLFSDAVIQPILGMAGGLEGTDEADPILGGTAMRVVASICQLTNRNTSLLDQSGRDLVRDLHRCLTNYSPSSELERLAYVDAASSLAASSATGMDLVLNDTRTRDAWLSLSVAQPKLKAAILVSIARVLDPLPEVDSVGDSVEIPRLSNEWAMKLYSSLGIVNGPESTELLLSLARSPLPETRLGAYSLLEAVAKFPTGGQVLFMHSGFYEFLIGRSIENTKEGREAKYAVVQAVLNSEVKGLLSHEIVKGLEKYISQGPHYVEVVRWQVAEQ